MGGRDIRACSLLPSLLIKKWASGGGEIGPASFSSRRRQHAAAKSYCTAKKAFSAVAIERPSVTRNGDLSPSWRFQDLIGDKKSCWRLAIFFWRFLAIMTAILTLYCKSLKFYYISQII